MPRGRKKIKIETPSTVFGATTTDSFNQNPVVEEKPIRKSKVGLNNCANCGKKLDAFVVGGGMRFCSDACMNEFLN